jgi:hypothetical protein
MPLLGVPEFHRSPTTRSAAACHGTPSSETPVALALTVLCVGVAPGNTGIVNPSSRDDLPGMEAGTVPAEGVSAVPIVTVSFSRSSTLAERTASVCSAEFEMLIDTVSE